MFGWADGMLVCMQFQGGRLCDWRCPACAADAARCQLNGTEPPWRAFADRTAALAALLT